MLFTSYRPYLFYCDYHEFLCEKCEDCDLPKYKLNREYSHGDCYYCPILNFKISK